MVGGRCRSAFRKPGIRGEHYRSMFRVSHGFRVSSFRIPSFRVSSNHVPSFNISCFVVGVPWPGWRANAGQFRVGSGEWEAH